MRLCRGEKMFLPKKLSKDPNWKIMQTWIKKLFYDFLAASIDQIAAV